MFLFWWFVVSQILNFIAFAFGGGVGRYHTTKLYRRLQWVTFILFTSIPVLILAILLLNLTPFSIVTEEYSTEYERIQKQRLVLAKRTQVTEIQNAKAERLRRIKQARLKRLSSIKSAKDNRQRKIQKAVNDRQDNINKAKWAREQKISKVERARQEKIHQAKEQRRLKQNKIDIDKRLYKAAIEKREKTIEAAKKKRLSLIQFEEDKRQAAYQRALGKYQEQIDDEWSLHKEQKLFALKPFQNRLRSQNNRVKQYKNNITLSQRYKRLENAITKLALLIAKEENVTIGVAFKEQLKQEIYDFDKHINLLSSQCWDYEVGQKVVLCKIVQEIDRIGRGRGQAAKYLTKRTNSFREVYGFALRLQQAEKQIEKLYQVQFEIKKIEDHYAKIYQNISNKFRKPLLSDFPEVDLSSFPEIKETDYPLVEKNKYPLLDKPDIPPVDLSKFPPVDLSQFPTIDMSKFPPIDYSKYPAINETDFPIVQESDFPKIDEGDFPLKLDRSPVNIKGGSFIDRLEPTFSTHFWWFLAAVFYGWVVFIRKFQTKFSYVYSRIMRFLDEGRFGFGGSARFASMLEEWGKPYKKNTLYVGRSLFNPFDEIGLDGEAHMLTIAGSRGGKGATAIIPNLLLWEGSAVVIDPKGTNAHVTANARRAMGQEVHIIDPFGIVTKESARFDPLASIKEGDVRVRERIATVADALVIPDDKAKDPHWDDGAKTIISGLISQIISEENTKKPLYEIRDLISQLPEEQDELWATMGLNEGGGKYAKDAAMRYIRGSQTNEMLSIMSSADKHTEWLSSPIMREIISNPTFEISDIKKRPTTIYLVIPPLQLERQNRLLRLFINLVIDAMEDGGRSKIPVLMFMDEFLALGKMPEISNAFATMASYNLILWPFVQELEKLQSIYGGSFNSFIANSRAIQVFSVSDPKTKDYISERLGNRPIGGLGNIAKSNDNLPLRASNDVELDLAASERRQYIIEAGKPAMILEKVPYYKSRPISWLKNKRGRFEGKYDPDPDFPEASKVQPEQDIVRKRWLLRKLNRIVRKAFVKLKAYIYSLM